MTVIPGAEEFYFKGNRIGCLLIHGFTGSPAEMKLLGERLSNNGYTILGVRLEGHGTSPEDMLRTTHTHWLESVEQGFRRLQRECEQIFVIGLSMGGILALHLASKYTVNGVISLAAPIFINNSKLPYLPLYRLFRTYEVKPRKPLPVDPVYNISYDRTPLKCVTSLLQLIDMVKRQLPNIKAPALIIQSRAERTVKPESAEYIYRNLTDVEDKKLIWLYQSGHIVTLDIERETVFEAIEAFVTAKSHT